MNFVYPGFLFALLAIAIPILIHLFNFRRFKKIYFTNVRFLQEIKQDTRSRSRLKHLLILIARILAVIFLVLAFAQPYLPSNNNFKASGDERVSIYVDNSFSMDALGKNGSLIDEAKRKAREIAAGYSSSAKFQLLTNEFKAEHQHLLSKEEFLTQLDEVQPASSTRTLNEIITRQQDALNSNLESGKGANRFDYVVSDFQKSTMNADDIKKDTAVFLNLSRLASNSISNLSVDSVWFSSPVVELNQPVELNVRIKNISDKAVENIPVTLTINKFQKGLASVNVEANTSAEVKLSFTLNESGWQKAEVKITDYPVTFDDVYYFSFNIRERLNVLSINGSAPSVYLDAIYSKDTYFNFKNVDQKQIDYSALNSFQLIFLNEVPALNTGLAQQLESFVKQGGSLVMVPAANADLNSYNELLKAIQADTYQSLSENSDKVEKLGDEHELFKDVFETGKQNKNGNLDLPVVKKYFAISRNTHSSSATLMKLQSGSAFFTEQESGKGKIYLSAVPFSDESSNFTHHALFVPVMYKIAMLSVQQSMHNYSVGADEAIEFNDSLLSGDKVFHVKNDDLKFDFIPEQRMTGNKMNIFVHDQIHKAGNYDLLSQEKLLSVISFNYNRNESDLRCYTQEELQASAEKTKQPNINVINATDKNLTHEVKQISKGTPLWKYCVIFCLVFLAAEILLIRLMKSK